MFHFPALPPHLAMSFTSRRPCTLDHGQVSPFGHPRINAQLATPRGLTQPFTSFIGSACPGIHRAPLHTHHTQVSKLGHIIQQHTQENYRKKSRPLYSSHTTHTKGTNTSIVSCHPRDPTTQPPTPRFTQPRHTATTHIAVVSHHTTCVIIPPPPTADQPHHQQCSHPTKGQKNYSP